MKKKFSILLFLIISNCAIGQDTILWKVTDTINSKTSYIVGTLHQLGNSFVDSIPEIKKSLYSSELAIFERINNEEKNELFTKREAINLKRKLGKKSYTKLVELSKNWELDIHKFKAIELELRLSQEIYKTICKSVNENDKWQHFDFYLQSLADDRGIPVLGFETFKEQLMFIDKEFEQPTWKSRKKSIQTLIERLATNSYDEQRCLLLENYKKNKLGYDLDVECPPSFLISKRNENWLKILPDLIRVKNCFVSVGFLHLKNKCGLLQKLKDEGFLVTPVKIKSVTSKA